MEFRFVQNVKKEEVCTLFLWFFFPVLTIHQAYLFCIPCDKSLQDKHFCYLKNSFLYNTKSRAQLAFLKTDNTALFSSKFASQIIIA